MQARERETDDGSSVNRFRSSGGDFLLPLTNISMEVPMAFLSEILSHLVIDIDLQNAEHIMTLKGNAIS